MTNRVCIFLLAVFSFATVAIAAPPINLIANGDFETGTFDQWTIVNTGTGQVVINNGSFDPLGPGEPLPPISGNFDALTEQPGPGFHALRQTIIVPDGVFAALLSWKDRVRNWAAIYSDPNQEWRVVIRDVAGNLVHEVFSTNPGDPLLQVGPNARSGDLTSVFQTLAGQTVIVSFEEQDNLSFFNATLDDVRLLASVLPVDKEECKKGGWATFINVVNGNNIFQNQGDCVSFVATKGKNPPANY